MKRRRKVICFILTKSDANFAKLFLFDKCFNEIANHQCKLLIKRNYTFKTYIYIHFLKTKSNLIEFD
jgi:hypothetical protein